MLTKQDIEAIAHLSRLEVGEDAEKLTEQINKLLDDFASLQAIDTSEIKPTSPGPQVMISVMFLPW